LVFKNTIIVKIIFIFILSKKEKKREYIGVDMQYHMHYMCGKYFICFKNKSGAVEMCENERKYTICKFFIDKRYFEKLNPI